MRPQTLGLVLGLVLAGAHQANAARLRSFVQVVGPSVHLSDLFTDLSEGQDCVLGDSPAPGARFVLQQPQLVAIASQFGVDWEPVGTGQTVTLDRPGRIVDEGLASAAIMTALNRPKDHLTVSLTSYQTLAIDRDATLSVAELVTGTSPGVFNAVLTASLQGHVVEQEAVSGQMDRVVSLPVPIRPIRSGDVIDEQDFRQSDFPASRLHGDVVTLTSDAVGLVATRYLPSGQPVQSSDLRHPDLVTRGGPVRIDLAGSGIELTASGTALEAGSLDDRVRVINPSSRAVLVAWVVGRNEVRVDPASTPIITASSNYGNVGMSVPMGVSQTPGDGFARGTLGP